MISESARGAAGAMQKEAEVNKSLIKLRKTGAADMKGIRHSAARSLP
jgi:hypothetical protein